MGSLERELGDRGEALHLLPLQLLLRVQLFAQCRAREHLRRLRVGNERLPERLQLLLLWHLCLRRLLTTRMGINSFWPEFQASLT